MESELTLVISIYRATVMNGVEVKVGVVVMALVVVVVLVCEAELPRETLINR